MLAGPNARRVSENEGNGTGTRVKARRVNDAAGEGEGMKSVKSKQSDAQREIEPEERGCRYFSLTAR